jgi:response regulator RpfG family c-di-GMP phosphodiesterase
MPELDGRELLKILAQKYSDLPRIVLTAVGSNEDILLALKTGAYDFLSKPIVDFAFLEHAVHRALERRKLADERQQAHQQLEKMNEVISMLNRGIDTDEIFRMLYVSLKSVLPFNRLTLVSADDESCSLTVRMASSDRKMLLPTGESISLDEDMFEAVINRTDIHIIDDIPEFLQLHPLPAVVDQILEEGFVSAIIMPIIFDGKTWGQLLFASDRKMVYRNEHAAFLRLIAGQVALSIQRGELLTELELHSKHLEHLVKVRTHEVLKTQKTTIFALSKLAEARDTETGEHLERMRNYALLLSQLLKYSGEYGEINNEFLRNIYDSSILHDIGKVGIPDMVLLKPGPLTPQEFEIMKTHPTIGYNALDEAAHELGENSFLDMAKDVTLYHHERWDGKGYPMGLSREEIPLAARIVTIGDVYDALTTRRPYKDAISHDNALKIMQDEDYRFDPKLLKLFLENNGDFDRIRRQFS